MKLVIIYVLLINLIAFTLYGQDKCRAAKGEWRIQEKILLEIAILGGSLGAFLGMQFFHHKTKKPKFYIGIPMIMLIQIFIGILIKIK
ncbi:MAG: DUF1294 domain-containing protein [Lachnospiraceae bacterium]